MTKHDEAVYMVEKLNRLYSRYLTASSDEREKADKNFADWFDYVDAKIEIHFDQNLQRWLYTRNDSVLGNI